MPKIFGTTVRSSRGPGRGVIDPLNGWLATYCKNHTYLPIATAIGGLRYTLPIAQLALAGLRFTPNFRSPPASAGCSLGHLLWRPPQFFLNVTNFFATFFGRLLKSFDVVDGIMPCRRRSAVVLGTSTAGLFAVSLLCVQLFKALATQDHCYAEPERLEVRTCRSSNVSRREQRVLTSTNLVTPTAGWGSGPQSN